jgi:hypothetical protein
LTLGPKEDVTWHVSGDPPDAGEVHGRTGILARLAALNPRGFWLTETDVLGSDGHFCACSEIGARREK